MPPRESTAKNFAVTAAVAVACSLAVSLTAVGLRGRLEANRDLDRMRAILQAAGLFDAQVPVAYAFRRVEGRFVDLDTGAYVPDGAVDPTARAPIPAKRDVAELETRERYVQVWLVRDAGGDVAQLVLPLRAQGWSTLHGFVALDRDLATIRGFVVHEHEETPGMGAEVDNPKWRARWPGKRIFDDRGRMVLQVVQGAGDAPHEVDGITGATLTTLGIQNMFRFWFGELGYARYLDRLREGGVDHG